MIRVEMHLFTEFERNIFNEMATIIENARRAQQEALHGNAEPGQRVADAPVQHGPHVELQDEVPSKADIVEQAAQLIRGAAVVDEAVVGHIEPKVELTYDIVEAAMHTALKTIGSVPTRTIITSFLPEGKRVKDMPEIWPELVKRLAEGK